MTARGAWSGVPILAAGLFCGCASDETTETSPPVDPPASCDGRTLLLPDGSCIEPGVPVDGCGEGFVHDGDRGCLAILPAEPCGPGLIAVPGDETCREIAPCGEAPWGDIPVEPNTVYVDGSFAGVSDGSPTSPFVRIEDGLAAAAPGAIVAVAAGSYGENVVLAERPARLWGRCPALVEVVGNGMATQALIVGTGADGSEVRGLSVTGTAIGAGVSGAEDVTMAYLWVHDTGRTGLVVSDSLGPATALIHDVLVERSVGQGLLLSDRAVVERTVTRDIQVGNDGWGVGIVAQDSVSTIVQTLVERSTYAGIYFVGAHGEITDTVVRDIVPAGQLDGTTGILVTEDADLHLEADVTVRRSLVERTAQNGITVGGATISVEATVVRQTGVVDPTATSGISYGLYAGASSYGNGSATMVVVSSLVELSGDAGVAATGAEIALNGSVIRDPLAGSPEGSGILSSFHPLAGLRGSVHVDHSLIERTVGVAVLAMGADLILDNSIVRDTLADPAAGHGRAIEVDAEGTEPASLLMRNTLVERSQEFGVVVIGGTATIEHSHLREISANAVTGQFGDAVGVTYDPWTQTASTLTMTGTRVDDAARAGLANWSATVMMGSNRLRCDAIDITGQQYFEVDAIFDDLGDNLCGCPDATNACKAVSSDVAPPTPPADSDQ